MANPTFRGILVEKDAEGKVSHSIREIASDQLPAGDLLIQVAYSSLNYKDGLALKGAPGIIRGYPMVPGIDLAGTVLESSSPDFAIGDPVAVTGAGHGERFWGGYGELARVRAAVAVKVPERFSLEQSMAIGTAGFTAMQCVMALMEHRVIHGGRPVVVSGAAGGVGSVAVALLSSLGYKVVASTGRESAHDHLWRMGASEIIGREALSAPGKPMETEKWSGAVDTVGAETLAGIIRSLEMGGSVAACGLAGGNKLDTTVFPFILRGVKLLGIDSVNVSREERLRVWERLEQSLPVDKLTQMTQTVTLDEVARHGAEILKGQVLGRTVVKVA